MRSRLQPANVREGSSSTNTICVDVTDEEMTEWFEEWLKKEEPSRYEEYKEGRNVQAFNAFWVTLQALRMRSSIK